MTSGISTPTLQVLGIHKTFGNLEVLKGISLEANSGDVVALLGSSGSGKSTFLRCINFLEHPCEGRILFRGEEVPLRRNRQRQLEPANRRELVALRTKLAMVFQGFNLWTHMTALENVMTPLILALKTPRAEARSLAEEALAKVDMADRRDFYPSALSGDQKQRVAIARALAVSPEVLLLDEPTSALDPELIGEVLAVMRKLAEQGRTMIVLTHEVGFARDVSNKVVFLERGKVETEGPADELFGRPGDYSARWAEFISHTQH